MRYSCTLPRWCPGVQASGGLGQAIICYWLLGRGSLRFPANGSGNRNDVRGPERVRICSSWCSAMARSHQLDHSPGERESQTGTAFTPAAPTPPRITHDIRSCCHIHRVPLGHAASGAVPLPATPSILGRSPCSCCRMRRMHGSAHLHLRSSLVLWMWLQGQALPLGGFFL